MLELEMTEKSKIRFFPLNSPGGIPQVGNGLCALEALLYLIIVANLRTVFVDKNVCHLEKFGIQRGIFRLLWRISTLS